MAFFISIEFVSILVSLTLCIKTRKLHHSKESMSRPDDRFPVWFKVPDGHCVARFHVGHAPGVTRVGFAHRDLAGVGHGGTQKLGLPVQRYLKRVHVILVEIVDLSVDVVDPGLADCDSSGLYFKREILVQSHPLGPPRQLPIAVDTIASRIYTGAATDKVHREKAMELVLYGTYYRLGLVLIGSA